MSDSIRDQLLGLGFKRSAPPAAAPKGKGNTQAPRAPGGKPAGKSFGKPGHKPGHKPARRDGEMDLARAYGMRADTEKRERMEAERQKQEEARLRREAREKLNALLTPERVLNAGEAADVARHFEYGGKIKRVYVTAEQLKALNAGELGVLQQNGRYLLVDAATLREAEAIFPQAVALKVDPDAPAVEDPYSDPKYQVPDDLVW